MGEKNDNNKKFEELFEKYFPGAYNRRKEQIKKNDINRDKGMGPEEFFKKHMGLNGMMSGSEEELGEPDEVNEQKVNGWVVVTKTWHTESGGQLTKQFWKNEDGTTSFEQGASMNGPSQMFGNSIVGMFLDPNQFMNMFMNPNKEMSDEELEEEDRMFNEIFGGGEPSNHFSFSDEHPYDERTLNMMLEQAIENEDYESAAKIRDVLDQKNNTDNDQ